jgi:predicted exporter
VLTWWLLILSVWIVATGMLGWFLQRWVPKALSGLETEVLYERIPELCQSLKERAALLVAGGEEPVRLLYQRLLEPELAEPHRRFRYLVDVQGGRSLQWREIAYLGEFLAAGEKERLTELEAIARTKVELDAHYTLQPLLRWWLALHLPPAIALAGLVGVHIATVVYY